jgi:hypothetical protein
MCTLTVHYISGWTEVLGPFDSVREADIMLVALTRVRSSSIHSL